MGAEKQTVPRTELRAAPHRVQQVLPDAPGAGAQHGPWGEPSSRVPGPPPLCNLDPGAHTATRPQGHRWTPPDHKTRLLGPQPARSTDIAGVTPESPSRRGSWWDAAWGSSRAPTGGAPGLTTLLSFIKTIQGPGNEFSLGRQLHVK